MIYISMAEDSGKDFLKCLAVTNEWEPGNPRIEETLRKALELLRGLVLMRKLMGSWIST